VVLKPHADHPVTAFSSRKEKRDSEKMSESDIIKPEKMSEFNR
jgi:hypothetical protein